jgi:DNA modification methylase
LIKSNIVLDPMMGTGRTGVASLNLKRQFIGIEKNAGTFKIAKANQFFQVLKKVPVKKLDDDLMVEEMGNQICLEREEP